MRPSITEGAALAAVLLSLAQRALWPGSEAASLSLLALACALTLAALAVNPRRWPLAPAVVALLIVLAQGLAGWLGGAISEGLPAPLGWTGLGLVALSAILAAGLPAGPLPAPDGPFKVGVASSELTRPDDAGERRLMVKVWYPAAPGRKRRRFEPMWSELPRLRELPGLVRGALGYLGGVRTHAAVGAAPAAQGAPYPLLVYNHSLLSFASENTLLMEALASRGFVVLSVRHQDQAAERAVLQRGVPDAERARDRQLLGQLARASSRAERARLSLELFRNSTGTPVIVRRRAADSRYVLDHLDAVLASVPAGGALAAGGRFGPLGLSLGGAVATRLCQDDPRCAGAANLDGGLYGIDEGRPPNRPYLMVYSEANAGTNDALLGAAAAVRETVLAGARHLDLHDAAVLFPILRWLGMLGARGGPGLNRRVAADLAAFFGEAMTR